MVATVGRYRDVGRATMPGELPSEGKQGAAKRKTAGAASGPLRSPSDEARRARQAQQDESAARLAKGREAGRSAEIRHGAVEDPNTALRGKRQRAAVNVATDALEREYANGRISDAGYHAGRTYKRVLERSRRPITAAGGWSPGDRVDHSARHDETILRRLEAAESATAMIADTAPVIGAVAGRVLEMALVDELAITEIARQIRGRSDRQDVIFYSQLFRESCEALADHWSRRGNRWPR